MLFPDVIKYIDQSILCWLATATSDAVPNVSPKEIFAHFGSDSIVIANIASPQSVKNIKENQNVCVSFIDVLVQKGYQVTGTASILKAGDRAFKECEEVLLKMTQGKYPFSSIIKIKVEKIKAILAPSYMLYPEITEKEKIDSAKKAYGLDI